MKSQIGWNWYEGARACLNWPGPARVDPPVPAGVPYPAVPTLVLNGDLDNITTSPQARELRLTLARDWSAAASPETADRLDHYWASLAMLERRLPDDPLVSELRFELEALVTLPPGTPAGAPR